MKTGRNVNSLAFLITSKFFSIQGSPSINNFNTHSLLNYTVTRKKNILFTYPELYRIVLKFQVSNQICIKAHIWKTLSPNSKYFRKQGMGENSIPTSSWHSTTFTLP